VEKGFQDSDQVIEGQVSCGSQYHFHLETQTCIVIPNGGLLVHSATQVPTWVQENVAKATALPQAAIVVDVKRCGGGYGGKGPNSNCVAQACAIAALKHGKTTRLVLNIDTNMFYLGKRHPYLVNYKIGVKNDGTVLALQMDVYADCGCRDTEGVGTTAEYLNHIPGAYNIPNLQVTSYLCKTNKPPGTWTRGPGPCQSNFAIENIVEHVAMKLNKSSKDIRQMALFKEGDVAPGERTLLDCTIPQIFSNLLSTSEFETRKAAVDKYNASNKWTKKGLCISTCRYDFEWGGEFIASIKISADGSILLTHGGVDLSSFSLFFFSSANLGRDWSRNSYQSHTNLRL